jgi:hypothetical protein
MAVSQQQGQQLDQIAHSLDRSGVWVSPELRSLVTPATQHRLEKAVAHSPTPVKVVVYPFDYQDQYGGDPVELLTLLHDHTGAPGVYLSVRDPGSPEFSDVVGRSWGTPIDAEEVTAPANENHPHHPVAAMLAGIRVIRDGRVQETYEKYLYRPEDQTDAGPTTHHTVAATPPPAERGPSWGAGQDVLVGVLALAVVALGVRLRRARKRTFQLPPSVSKRIRTAEDQQLLERARSAVLDLGERLDAHEIGPRDDRGSWQAALDHYDAAGRLLDQGTPDVLDVVGALVLAGRGQQALAAAVAGRPFTPATTCFLNPLHAQPGTSRSRVEVSGQVVKVPLCAGCLDDLRHGRTPDVLDVLRHGRAVHYFETDAEPWASTGYGALEPDLLRRLHTRA